MPYAIGVYDPYGRREPVKAPQKKRQVLQPVLAPAPAPAPAPASTQTPAQTQGQWWEQNVKPTVDAVVAAVRSQRQQPATPRVASLPEAPEPYDPWSDPRVAGLLKQVQAAKPKTYSVPEITERPGQTVDLSQWFSAIGQQPRQWQTPQPSTPQTFNLEQLQQALARPLPEIGQPRFATPEQLGQWIAQFQQVQEPWLQAATQLAQAEANKQLQGLQSQWAARGLLASGGAAAQERQAATDLGRQLAEVRTRALADAVGQALQAGQLSLEEAAQLWQQAYQGRQADVENLLRALSQQEQMRQWEQAFGLDVEQLRSQDWANWLNQLAGAWQTEVGQSQWAQELGLQRASQEFQRWLGTQQLNQQAQSEWLARLLQAGGLAEEARQFERQMPLREAELTGLLYGQPTLPARQFDWQRALQEAGLTGTWQGQPTWERILQEAGLTGLYQGQPIFERWLAEQQLKASRRSPQQSASTRLKESAWGKLAAGIPFSDLTEGEKIAIGGFRGVEAPAPSLEDDKAALRDALLGGATHAELAKKIDDAVNRGDITAAEGLQLKEFLYSFKVLGRAG